ncbi:uncharacterized protein [Spinacia oleracea]|uniref:Endonuclease/exonuclease/phosphatase domain-containing protein n=1 Tax=Spinacia oleracea TaxID=3562 RepID=A0ABM3RJ39_SPIOL|nr:uncharacterized protein LOC130470081 [Spinacia oleracea]
MGDFNSILLSGDKENANPVTDAETRDFEACLDRAALYELKSCGHFFSWSNKGQGNPRISSRINRALGNKVWHSGFTDAVVDYINPGLSDHSLLLMTCTINLNSGSRPFKIFNYMAYHPSFLKVVQKGWEVEYQGSSIKDVGKVQTQPAANHTDVTKKSTDKECIDKLKKFLHVQESSYRKKSRIQWLQAGGLEL